MNKKIILFDLDGTITDSGEGIINCCELALRHYGLPVPSREEMRVFVGPPLHEMFEKHGVPAEECQNAIEVFRSRYTTIGIFENTPYPGIRELLEFLRETRIPAAITSSSPLDRIREYLEDQI